MPTPRSALTALAIIAPAPSVGVVLGITLNDSIWAPMGWGLAKVWLFGLPVIWHVWVDRQRVSFSPARSGGFGVGFLTGLVAVAGIVGGYVFVGRGAIHPKMLHEAIEPLGLTRPGVYWAACAYWVMINSVLEEYVFRWFIVRKCEALVRPGAAIALSAAIFVVHHTIAMSAFLPPWVNLIASVAIFVAGAVWSWLYVRYRSVWVPYLSHAMADVAIFGVGAYLLFGTG